VGAGGCRYGGNSCYQVEKKAQERAILLATVCGEADEAAQRVSTLEGELMARRQAQDATEGKFLSLLA
jgi:hypothetical protein